MNIKTKLKAINNASRLQILEWLKNPDGNFPVHEINLSFENGVSDTYIQEKTGISQATTSQYMSLLHQAGLVVPTRIGKWIYYKRDEEEISEFMQELNDIITIIREEND